jgi:hypothetical protein
MTAHLQVSNTFRRLRVPLFVAAVVALNISFWHTSETYCHSRDNGSVAIVDSKGERSPLSIDPRDYVGDDPFKLPDEMPEFPKPSRPHVGHRVPSVVHYAFGMRDSPPDFPYWAYLSVRSTIDRLSPDIIYL